MVRRGDRRRPTVRRSAGNAGPPLIVRPFEPLRPLSDDEVAHIHDVALRYLADHGMRVLLDEARDVYRLAGSSVDDESMMVRLDPDRVTRAIGQAPSRFEIVASNHDRSVVIGGSNVVLAPVGGPPFVEDRLKGRRAGTMADQENFLKLTQTADVIGLTAPSVEPTDVPLNERHLRSGLATLTLTDKVPYLYARGRQRMRDGFELIKCRHQLSTDEAFASRPRCWININTNSPRQLDGPMATAIIDCARLRQPVAMTPFTLAGAMAPVILAGALVLQHMEVLAALTLAQIVEPGAPVVYGGFTSNVDMRTGSPAFGTPEAVRGALASGQLARHVGLPWRSSGSSTSNAVDAQAGYETMMNTWGALLGGANVIMHAAGWQEGGLTACYEKFVVDLEMCQMMAEVCRPIAVDEDELALASITEIGPGGHFFGTEHTLARYADAFYEPIVFGRTTYEQWAEDGRRRTDERATEVWQRLLADYEPPPIPADVEAAMTEHVERRIAEGGAAPA